MRSTSGAVYAFPRAGERRASKFASWGSTENEAARRTRADDREFSFTQQTFAFDVGLQRTVNDLGYLAFEQDAKGVTYPQVVILQGGNQDGITMRPGGSISGDWSFQLMVQPRVAAKALSIFSSEYVDDLSSQPPIS